MKSVAYFMFVLLPELMQAITVTPNGNSPGLKMAGGIRVELQKGGFIPISPNSIARHGDLAPPEFIKGSKLSAKERFRRLIPYINFYQNDNSDHYDSTNKLPPQLRSKEATMRYNNAPQYFGNYKKQPNISPGLAPKYPKVEAPQFYQEPVKLLPEYDLYDDLQSIRVPSKNQFNGHLYDFLNPIPVPVQGTIHAPPKESVNLFNANVPANVQYYEDNLVPLKNYKLVPYEQTPPVSTQPNENIHYFSPREFDFSDLPQEVSIYSRPNNHLVSNTINSKTTVSSTYDDGSSNSQTESYEQVLYNAPDSSPRTETGFKPIVPTTDPTTLGSPFTTIANGQNTVKSRPNAKAIIQSSNAVYDESVPVYNTENLSELPFHNVNELATLLKALQRSNSLPQKLTAENIGPSLKTLVKILKGVNSVEASDAPEPAVSTPRPFQLNVQQPTTVLAYHGPSTVKAIEIETANELLPEYPSQDLEIEHYPNIENQPSSVDMFPAHTPEGGTPGRPGIDYPILSAIPRTSFDCNTQRYKGFFGDPETDCQVWHYCDLNGGQASFLCPNGTIFSQVGLTCDWWFNVKCSTTTQLYVLNERLYKYILPYTPKFPEDYSGPLVDKYLTLKYKEMEENFKKNRKHNEAMDKIEDAIKSASKENPKIDETKVSNVEPEIAAEQIESPDAFHAENRIGGDAVLPFVEKVETKEYAVEVNNPGTSGALSPYEE